MVTAIQDRMAPIVLQDVMEAWLAVQLETMVTLAELITITHTLDMARPCNQEIAPTTAEVALQELIAARMDAPTHQQPLDAAAVAATLHLVQDAATHQVAAVATQAVHAAVVATQVAHAAAAATQEVHTAAADSLAAATAEAAVVVAVAAMAVAAVTEDVDNISMRDNDIVINLKF